MVARIATIGLLLQVAAFAALALAEAVPDGPVLDNVHASVERGAITAVGTERLSSGGVADRFGECVLATIGTGAGDRSWFETVAVSPNLGNCPTMIERLDARADGVAPAGEAKIRYWNGIAVIARPMFAVVGIEVVRIVAVVALLAAFGFTGWSVARTISPLAAGAAAFPIVTMTDLVGLGATYHHTLMFAAGVAGLGVLVRSANREPALLAVAAFVVGSVYSFLDLMNFVLGFWLGGAILVGVAVEAAATRRARLAAVATAGALWALGYATMWIGRWVWAAAATSPGAVADEIGDQVAFRIDGESAFATGEFGAGLRATVAFLREQRAVEPLIVVALVGAVVALVVARRARADLATMLAVASPAVVAVPAFLVANNHFEIHYWFEYRSLPVIGGAGLAMLVAAAQGRFSGVRALA